MNAKEKNTEIAKPPPLLFGRSLPDLQPGAITLKNAGCQQRSYLHQLMIRSPHPVELLCAVGLWHVTAIYVAAYRWQQGFAFYVAGLCIGGIVYTFLEYWFHRELMHRFLWRVAHEKHHKAPRKLKIITNPLMPVLITGVAVTSFVNLLLGPSASMLVIIGMAAAHLVTEFTHILVHTSYNPWWMKSMREWHLHHHIPENYEVGHGFTSSFWDAVFRTLPDNYPLYVEFPYLKWIGHLPVPLGMMCMTPWLYRMPSDKIKPDGSFKRMRRELQQLDAVQLKYAVPALVCGCFPLLYT